MTVTPRIPVREGDLIAGRYRVLRRIGKGGMSTVWAARHELLGRDFALKLATVSAHAGPDARARFLREAQIVGKLRHPNVVDVADVGDVAPGAGLYLAMELLEGESLAERIRDHAPLAPTEALAIVGEVCRGLAAAHEAGVIHRDIKPENIFLARGTAGGIVPKLLDFGISKAVTGGEISATDSDRTWGTPAYMSPEQARGEDAIDRRADVWALGIVLFEMLTGERPFNAESFPALLACIADEAPAELPPSVPEEARTIVRRCLAREPNDRFPTAESLRRALDAARGALGDPALPSGRPIERSRAIQESEPPPPPIPSSAKRSRATWLIAALALMTAVGAALFRSRSADPGVTASPSITATAAVTAAPATPTTTLTTVNVGASAEPTSTAGAAVVPTTTAAPSARTRPRGSPGKSVTRIDNAGF